MRIGLDLDGVVAEQNDSVFNYINNAYGLDLETHVPHWNPHIEEIGKDYDELFNEAIENEDNFYYNMETVSGSVKTVNRLAEKHTIVILTHRPRRTHDDSREWLEKIGLHYDEFIHDVPEDKTRGAPVDVLLDDRLPVLRLASENNVPGFLFTRSHNALKEIPQDMHIHDVTNYVTNRVPRSRFQERMADQWKAVPEFISEHDDPGDNCTRQV